MRAPAALLAILLTAGCLGGPAPEEDAPREDVATDAASLRPIAQQFAGSATGSPAAPYEERFTFDVPRGAVGVNGTLTYERPPASVPLRATQQLALDLLDPDGEVASSGYEDVDGRIIVATVDPPKAGTWTFVVSSRAAPVGVPYTLDAVAELIVPEHNLVAKTVRLGQRSFYEVNLILEKDASFTFSFNASAPVRWDVHSHPPSGLKEWETGEGATGGMSFTAPDRDVYSVLWENPGALPADLRFEVGGKFRMHSHSG